jgi:hypothetical protein
MANPMDFNINNHVLRASNRSYKLSLGRCMNTSELVASSDLKVLRRGLHSRAGSLMATTCISTESPRSNKAGVHQAVQRGQGHVRAKAQPRAETFNGKLNAIVKAPKRRRTDLNLAGPFANSPRTRRRDSALRLCGVPTPSCIRPPTIDDPIYMQASKPRRMGICMHEQVMQTTYHQTCKLIKAWTKLASTWDAYLRLLGLLVRLRVRSLQVPSRLRTSVGLWPLHD